MSTYQDTCDCGRGQPNHSVCIPINQPASRPAHGYGGSFSKEIKILLVDAQPVVRTGIRMLIESRPGFTVVGEAANEHDALKAALDQPDIILLGLDPGEEDTLALLPELLALATGARALILTGRRDPDLHHEAVRRGAMGLVHKEDPAEALIKAIERVHAGEVWLDGSTVARILTSMRMSGNGKSANPEDNKIATLTDREREVIALIAEGLRNRNIAERLFISSTTVRHHLTSIFGKLGVSDRLELLIYAYRNGLARPPFYAGLQPGMRHG